MSKIGTNQIKALVLQKAADNDHVLLIEESDFTTKKNKVVFFCKKCNKKNPPREIRSYLQNKNGCYGCYGFDLANSRWGKEAQEKRSNTMKAKGYPTPLKDVTGVNHPCFKNGGVNTILRPSSGSTWARLIRKNYNFKCYICTCLGKKSGRDQLEVHHLNGLANFPELAKHPNNGVCLCKNHHAEYHSKYGDGTRIPITQGSFNTYLKNDLGIEGPHPWDVNPPVKEETTSQLNNHENLVDPLEKEELDIETDRQMRQAEFEKEVQAKGHVVVSYPNGFINHHSSVVIHCPSHNTNATKTVLNYKRSQHGLPCCTFKRRENYVSYLYNFAKNRNETIEFIGGVYVNVQTKVKITCKQHCCSVVKTVETYRKYPKALLPCCKQNT